MEYIMLIVLALIIGYLVLVVYRIWQYLDELVGQVNSSLSYLAGMTASLKYRLDKHEGLLDEENDKVNQQSQDLGE